MVRFQGKIAVRETVLELLIPAHRLDALEELQPQKRRVVLA